MSGAPKSCKLGPAGWSRKGHRSWHGPAVLCACMRASGPTVKRMAIFIAILYTPSRRSFAQHGLYLGPEQQFKTKANLTVANVAISLKARSSSNWFQTISCKRVWHHAYAASRMQADQESVCQAYRHLGARSVSGSYIWPGFNNGRNGLKLPKVKLEGAKEAVHCAKPAHARVWELPTSLLVQMWYDGKVVRGVAKVNLVNTSSTKGSMVGR